MATDMSTAGSTNGAGQSPNLGAALAYAAHVHSDQQRKGTTIPYISHLLAVTAIVLENGGTTEEAIAAILHDAVEDNGGEKLLVDIETRFGATVAGIVKACSDSLVDDRLQEKEDWSTRKRRYITHLRECSEISVHLVSAADKLHNARATAADYATHGDALWKRFNPAANRDGTLWYYNQMIAAYDFGPPDPRRDPIVRELRSIIAAITAVNPPVYPEELQAEFAYGRNYAGAKAD